MKIAIEALVHEGQAQGAGRYARLLLEGLEQFGSRFEYYLFDYLSRDYRRRTEALWLPSGPNFETRLRWFPRPLMPWLEDRLGLRVQDRWLRKAGVDLFHGLRGLLPPLSPRIKKLLTVHDLQFKINPGWFEDKWYRRFDQSVAETDFVITGSQHTAQDLKDLCGLPAEKLAIVPYGVSPLFRVIEDRDLLEATRGKYRLPEKFVLFVGGLRPLKNLERLTEAFAAVASEFPDVSLALVGKSISGNVSLLERIVAWNLVERVQFTGYVPEADLVHLYNLATVFAFPSLYEGFGYPVLEAMACGTPVLSSNVSSLPDVCGEAAEFVSPENPDSIAFGLRRLLASSDRRDELIQKGHAQRQKFTWRTCIERHLQIYEQLLN